MEAMRQQQSLNKNLILPPQNPYLKAKRDLPRWLKVVTQVAKGAYLGV